MSNTAICDVTKKPLNLNDGCLVANMETGEWLFCSPGEEQQVSNPYVFPEVSAASDLLGFVDLLSHVGTKPWFDEQKFFSKIKALRPY